MNIHEYRHIYSMKGLNLKLFCTGYESVGILMD
jgi:hypothetical protein